jgi:geranylgeranyl pyrophosphate synthase
MDAIEDNDLPPEGPPAASASGSAASSMAASLATGLYFTASLILSRLSVPAPAGLPASQIAEDFYTSLLALAAGQNADLTAGSVISLDQYWEIAAGKSGTFFSLACRTGAARATSDPDVLASFGQAGHHLGSILQVMDDTEEVQALVKPEVLVSGPSLLRSLPVVFLGEVASHSVIERLHLLLSDPVPDMQSRREVYNILDENGAALYVAAELERHRQASLNALDHAAPALPENHPLRSLLQGL